MPQNLDRSRRVGHLIRNELATLVSSLKDPRIGFVTISAVDVNKDLSVATVYFTVLDNDQLSESLDGLIHAAGYLKNELSKRTKLRQIPDLHFKYDQSIRDGDRLSKLINESLKNPVSD